MWFRGSMMDNGFNFRKRWFPEMKIEQRRKLNVTISTRAYPNTKTSF